MLKYIIPDEMYNSYDIKAIEEFFFSQLLTDLIEVVSGFFVLTHMY